MGSTTSIAVANNQAAAQITERIMNRENVKAAIAKLAEAGSNGFDAFVNKIHDLNALDDDGVRDEVRGAFSSAREMLEYEVKAINKVASFSKGLDADGFAEAVQTFLEIEKEIQGIQDIGKFRKVALMFWSGLKFIAGFILKSAMKAAKFIATYGIRFIAAGIDFIIKIVQETVKFVKRVVAAVRVAIDGREEIIDVEARECE